MLKRILFICGIAAVLLYAAAVIAGGVLRPGYDHMSMAINGLTERGAPNKLLLDILFGVSFALLMSFAWAVGMSGRGEGLSLFMAGSIVLGITGALGLVMTVLFPADPAGAAPTVQGSGRILLGYGVSLGTVMSVFFIGMGSRIRDSFWVFSIVMGVLVLAAQAVSVAFAVAAHPLLGLAERIAFGLFFLWLLSYIGRLFVEDSGRV